MISFAWNWVRKNAELLLMLSAMGCLTLALGELIRDAAWSVFMPVTLSAAVCSWWLGISRLKTKQAWLGLIVLGILGVFIYVGELARPFGRLLLAASSLIPQTVLLVSDQIPIDTAPLLLNWADLSRQITNLLVRLWEWWAALFAGRQLVDPVVARLVWSVLLWLVGIWSGWGVRRNRQVLGALIPGGVVLTLVLNYSREDVGLLIMYLALMLVLMGLVQVDWMHQRWDQRKVDYSESIRIETLAMVGVMTIALVFSAAGTPSLSWRELLDNIRGSDQTAIDRTAETLGLERQPNVANDGPYRSNGLPRGHLLGTPPELLQDVVMTVSTGDLPPMPEDVTYINPNRYYWRSITYDVYSGTGWSSRAAEERSLPAQTSLLPPPSGYRIVNQHVKRLNISDTSLYWTGILAQSDVKLDIAWRIEPPDIPDHLLNGDMLGALTEYGEYSVTSYLPQYDAGQLRSANSEYPQEISSRYLQLPESTPNRVLTLARKLTQSTLTPYDRAIAIETYLRTFPYTLDVEPPPPNRDVVDYFLFTAQQGYCDYYATSMVVLARSVGLPARIVIGYASGDYDSLTAEYIVRREHAHSWAEIYFSGFGWVEFEPTANQPAIVRRGDTSTSGTPPNLPGSSSAFSGLKAQWRALLSSLGGQFLVAGMGLILLFMLWQGGEIIFLRLLPAHRAIARIYSRMEKASVNLLPDLPNGHTPHELGTALTRRLRLSKNRLLATTFFPASKEIKHIVSLYVSQVFSEHPPAKTQVWAGIRAWSRLRWRLWLANRWAQYLADQSKNT